MPSVPKSCLALVQMCCSPDPAENRARAVEKIRDAAARGANIVCLPELFASQYFCQSEDHANFNLAESIPGPSSDVLGALAAELRLVIVASLFERRAAGLYHNTAIVIDADGSLLGRYRKMHIPDDPLYYEKFYFTPGDLGFRSWDTQHGKLGVCVCWDQWFPEAARLTALSGAQLLFYPTAIGWHPGEKEEYGPRTAFELGNDPARPCHRQRLLRRRPSNRVGPRKPPSAARASSSGAKAFSAVPTARSSPRRASTTRKRSSPTSTSRVSSFNAPTGHSCATAASTPTPT